MIGRIRITRRRSGAWRALALAAVLLLGCEDPASPESAVSSSGADEDVAPEPAPEIEPVAAQEPSFGPTLPYSVELGRGGGRSGLETIRVEPDGAVTLHRNPSRRGGVGWEWATLALSEPQRAELTESLGRGPAHGRAGTTPGGVSARAERAAGENRFALNTRSAHLAGPPPTSRR